MTDEERFASIEAEIETMKWIQRCFVAGLATTVSMSVGNDPSHRPPGGKPGRHLTVVRPE